MSWTSLSLSVFLSAARRAGCGRARRAAWCSTRWCCGLLPACREPMKRPAPASMEIEDRLGQRGGCAEASSRLARHEARTWIDDPGAELLHLQDRQRPLGAAVGQQAIGPIDPREAAWPGERRRV